jgi:hypothetical protein
MYKELACDGMTAARFGQVVRACRKGCVAQVQSKQPHRWAVSLQAADLLLPTGR